LTESVAKDCTLRFFWTSRIEYRFQRPSNRDDDSLFLLPASLLIGLHAMESDAARDITERAHGPRKVEVQPLLIEREPTAPAAPPPPY
jgi:hypothetical protein